MKSSAPLFLFLNLAASVASQQGQAAIQEDCLPFNPEQAAVNNVQGSWKITVDNNFLLDFGSKEDQARAALDVIGSYQLNKQCFVGRPDPSMQYFLIGDAAPAGELRNEDCIAFNLPTTQVQKVEGRWKIVDGSHFILDFNQENAEADTAMEIMIKHEFNHICFVGRPNPPMMYFRQ